MEQSEIERIERQVRDEAPKCPLAADALALCDYIRNLQQALENFKALSKGFAP